MTTWMEREGIVPSEASQRKLSSARSHSDVKPKNPDLLSELHGSRQGRGWGNEETLVEHKLGGWKSRILKT